MKTLQSNIRNTNNNKSWLSKQRNSLSINSKPSFIRFKKRLNTESDQRKVLGNKNFNVQREYLIEKNSKQKRDFGYKKCQYGEIQKQKIVRRDKMSIEYENQLKTEINQINQTLKIANQIIQKFHFSIIQKDRSKQRKLTVQSSQINFPSLPSLSKLNSKFYQPSIVNQINKSPAQSCLIPSNIFQLIQIQQKIKNKDRQNRIVERQIYQLKENIYSSKNVFKSDENKKQQNKKKSNKQNQNRSRINQYYFNQFKSNQNLKQEEYFILAKQIHQFNQQLSRNIELYDQKYQEFMNLKNQIEEFKMNHEERQVPLSYEKFCQNKIKRQIQRENQLKQISYLKPNIHLQSPYSSRLSSKNIQSQNQSIRSSRLYYYSNLSKISGLVSSRINISNISKRQYLPNQIPSLPKQKNPTLKSLNNKRQKLRKALKIQQMKYQKDLTQNFDKILFLRDQDLFLTEQIDFLINQLDELQQKFSFCQLKSQIKNQIGKNKYRSMPLKYSKSHSTISFFRDINNYEPISHINCQSKIQDRL